MQALLLDFQFICLYFFVDLFFLLFMFVFATWQLTCDSLRSEAKDVDTSRETDADDVQNFVVWGDMDQTEFLL